MYNIHNMVSRGSYSRAFNLSSFHVPDLAGPSTSDPERPGSKKARNLMVDFDPENPYIEKNVELIKLLLDDENLAFESSSDFSSDVSIGNPLLEGFIDVVREHVNEFGPIQSLVLNGHGGTFRLGNGTLSVYIDLEDALVALERLSQEEFCGVPLVEGEIVLNGCNTLDLVGPENVGVMREYAMRNKVNIVGLVSTLVYAKDTAFWEEDNELAYFGRYVQFGEDGAITVDEYNKDNFPDQYKSQLEQGWEQYYLDKTVTFEQAQEAHEQAVERNSQSDALERLGFGMK